VIFDPHRKYLFDNEAGIRIGFNENLQEYLDQFKPYLIEQFDCDLKNKFNGTFFRLPLRTQEAAELSEISDKEYKEEDVLNLFDSFEKEAREVPLFLKNIENIQVMIWEENEKEPTLRFSVEIGELSSETKENRRALIERYVSRGSEYLNSLNQPSPFTYHLQIKHKVSDSIFEEKWLITNLMGTGDSKKLAIEHIKTKGMKLIPWIQMATKLYQPTDKPLQGRLFCFLPMSNYTKMTSHINGFL
jgi:hypothetical protein